MNVLDTISVQYNDIVIVGDFNTNLLARNSLIDPMLSLGLTPVNTVTPTHFHRLSNSLIDLVFVNNISKVLLYDQILASGFSNHDLLFVTYDVRVPKPVSHYFYRDLHNIDFNFLYELFENINWHAIYFMDDVNNQIDFLQKNINSLYDTCVPIKTKRVKKSREPWFTTEIETLIKKRNAAHYRWKRFKTPELQIIFQELRRKVVKSIKESKRNFYQRKFSSAINSRSKWNEIRKIGIGRENSSTREIDVNIDNLNKRFVNIDIPKPTQNFYADISSSPIGNTFSFRCVSQCEVLLSYTAVKSKAIGVDEINPSFLEVIMPGLLPFVTHIFNTILTKSVYPEEWKISKIIPIPKPNNDYRPIAILPYLSKVLENIMSKQINEYLEQSKLLSDRQSGFVKGRSCITALTDVIENLRSNLDEEWCPS